MSSPTVLRVADDEDGARVDAFVARRLPEVSRRFAKALAKRGAVRCEGARLDPSTPVRAGQAIEVEIPQRDAGDSPALDVLHLDDDYVYVHKPSGMHTVRIRPDDPPTVADALARMHPECAEASPRPLDGGALHRLDQGTSGVVVFARHRDAWTQGREAIGAHASKIYLARTAAHTPALPIEHVRTTGPPEALPPFPMALPADGLRVDAPLLAHGSRGARVCVDPQGIPATSDVWIVAPGRVLVRLHTGRRHQARVHLAYLGLPIEGDAEYGPLAPTPTRLHLHAWSVQLNPDHPRVHTAFPTWF